MYLIRLALPSKHIFYLIWLHLLLLVAIARAAEVFCYYPDGTAATPDKPCFGGDGVESHCCHRGDLCIASQACISKGTGVYWRGSCTVLSWATPNCTDHCGGGGRCIIGFFFGFFF